MGELLPFGKRQPHIVGVTRVYVDAPKLMGRGIHRVARALKAHVPANVSIVNDAQQADVIVFHVVGVQNFSDTPLHEQIANVQAVGKRYAMMQYCFTTTENGGDIDFWGPLWSDAAAVWSYYDLPLLSNRFYYAPLGADHEVFKPNPRQRKLFKIGTSGTVAETEGAIEAAAACARTGDWMFHLGPDLKFGAHVACQSGLTDVQVADRWRECEYVAGLRRVEGFELPAVEGLLCGSVPVLFDAPHYREWFDGLGIFVPEQSPDFVRGFLESVFERPYAPLTEEQYQEARKRFDWATLVNGFWERAL